MQKNLLLLLLSISVVSASLLVSRFVTDHGVVLWAQWHIRPWTESVPMYSVPNPWTPDPKTFSDRSGYLEFVGSHRLLYDITPNPIQPSNDIIYERLRPIGLSWCLYDKELFSFAGFTLAQFFPLYVILIVGHIIGKRWQLERVRVARSSGLDTIHYSADWQWIAFARTVCTVSFNLPLISLFALYLSIDRSTYISLPGNAPYFTWWFNLALWPCVLCSAIVAATLCSGVLPVDNENACLECGYSKTGVLSTVCPECGIASGTIRCRWGRLYFGFSIIVLACACFVVVAFGLSNIMTFNALTPSGHAVDVPASFFDRLYAWTMMCPAAPTVRSQTFLWWLVGGA
jgi:hypothetical protein